MIGEMMCENTCRISLKAATHEPSKTVTMTNL